MLPIQTNGNGHSAPQGPQPMMPSRMLDEWFRGWPMLHAGAAQWLPAADVEETAEAFVVRLEVPGIARDALSLSVLEDQLTVTGTKADVSASDAERAVHRECRRGTFTREFRFGTALEPEQAHAEMADGVLTITLPKAPTARARSIEVRPG